MKVLVLNGSPRGQKSNTLRITEAFLEGLEAAGKQEITRIDVREKKIEPCLGCFACWKDTPGKCVIKDDMEAILPLLVESDLVLWSFPLYYFSMPSKIKALMDRMLPLNLPFMEERPDGGASHPSRYDLSHQRTVVVSSCGFFSATNNYEALDAQFSIAFGKNNVEKIFCPQGEILQVKELKARTDEYLSIVRKAGTEYAENFAVSQSTKAELELPMLSEQIYAQVADASWGIEKPASSAAGAGSVGPGSGESALAGANGEDAVFIRQMAAFYNPEALSGAEAVLEISFTDLGRTYRLHLGKEKCAVLSAEEAANAGTAKLPLTRIETPYSVWKQISAGELDGAEAMMQGKYRVSGKFDLMMKMDALFDVSGEGGSSGVLNDAQKTLSKSRSKKTNMNLVIFAFLPLWIALPFSSRAGLISSIVMLILLQAAGSRWIIGIHERIAFSGLGLGILALAAGVSPHIVIPFSYVYFGMHWLLSCAFPVPLTAEYSKNGYGGDSALKNALFVKTNRIITAAWGILYLATAVWTIFLLSTPLSAWTGAINSLTPALCGLWTAWFQKWYPAKVASGK